VGYLNAPKICGFMGIYIRAAMRRQKAQRDVGVDTVACSEETPGLRSHRKYRNEKCEDDQNYDDYCYPASCSHVVSICELVHMFDRKLGEAVP